MQLHGHLGYMQGPIARFLCDSAGTRIAGGTSDIQRVNIFNQLQKNYEYRDRD
jgi:alkylation response protein AidB-like acyl-CoA dehydrogenase